jgi:hypothetical protein
MRFFTLHFTIVVTAFGLVASSAARADSFTSSAASAASQAVGSVSTSLQGSSNSSSGGKTVAEGNYEVTNVAAAQGKPGMLNLRLKAAAATTDGAGNNDDGAFTLVLPQAALGERGIATGETVQVRHRPYGYEFARASNREPFFLVLADAWMRELDARPI